MNLLEGLVLYILIGIIGRKIFGYKGLVETVLWPLGILCVWYLKRKERESK